MVRLPVSGIEVTLRAPDGTDDILLQEASGNPIEIGLALLARLARGRARADGVKAGNRTVGDAVHRSIASDGAGTVDAGHAGRRVMPGNDAGAVKAGEHPTFHGARSGVVAAGLHRHDEDRLGDIADPGGSVRTDTRGHATGSEWADFSEWPNLSVTDFEFLLLSLRANRFGQHLALGFACPECGARVEVGFRVADYLSGVTPRAVAGVMPDPARQGWFLVDGARFRLPTAGDQAAIASQPNPARHLAERCLDVAARRPPRRGRVLRAMAAMAPEVSRPIAGTCPDCATAVQAPLHVTRVVVGELRRAAGAVHDDVDLIARTYHWPEAAILALPQDRRRAYAERIRRAPAQAA